SCLLAENEETQVRAIDLQVRQWLLAGQQNIGIICEDRKLARRLRALLDRADVSMQDLSGWSLATTQAATVIERWLQCIEEDFDARPLLDCLKSPFVQALSAPGLQKEKPTEADENEATPGRHQATRTDTPQDDYRYLVYRFEHDIILHENVHSNLQRYREQLLRRQDRLSHWPSASHQQLLDILNRLEAIAAPLQQLQSARKPVNASRYLATLIDSIEQLGIRAAYQQDAAGLRLLQTLDELRLALHYADPVFSWQDFRYWLGSALEEKLFSPQTRSSKVKLMTLEQAELQAFDALIIAAVEPQHFPGKAASSPFFNQAVRQALALGSWRDDYQQRFRKFRQALFAAPTILLTALSEENGEDIAVSPWLEMLLQFHQQVYGEQPLNTQLKKLLASDSNVFRCDTDTLPEPAAAPAPVLAAPLQPEKYSASSHQRLINCPYQFFASDGLKLRPLEEISTELSKADYGERIHTILQCFHGAESPASRYFGVNAFAENITVANREKAQQHLVELSERVFSKDLEDNVLHRSWLQRWLKHIPSYIDWQIKQQENWRIVETEQSAETSLDQTHRLYGRLDRIDAHLTQPGDYAIIDYKTGSSAKQPEIESGEDVQLTTYALLETRAVEVKYLSLDTPGQRVKTGASLAGEQLDELREKTGARLQQLIDSLGQQHPMPAWGDESVCCYCDFAGLCRRQQWRENG
ncbi:MAG TPA: Dna2/Cas4 domain-containing protein, partial [Thiotrichales bacterium]|nr:Dna2/Cas4 domain-containing protein [Thiotrichales bacterium]